MRTMIVMTLFVCVLSACSQGGIWNSWKRASAGPSTPIAVTDTTFTETVFVFSNAVAGSEVMLLDGPWNVDGLDFRGKHFGPRELADSALPGRVVFTKKKPLGAEKRCDIYLVDLDTKVAPKRLTATVIGGELKGHRQLGIYEVREKQLILQMSEFGAEAFPKQFGPNASDWHFKLTRASPIKGKH